MTDFSFILQKFIPESVLLSADPIGAGHINDTFALHGMAGGQSHTWLLQRLNHRVFTRPEVVMDNIAAVAHHLAGRSDYPLRIPAPFPVSQGGWLYRDDAGDYWRLSPFFEHTYTPERLPSADEAYEAARAYGMFLYALRDFPADTLAETIPGFHDTLRRWTVFETVLQNDPAGRVALARPEIEAMRAAYPVFNTVDRLVSSGVLPRRVTHNDTKAGNVLLDRATGRAVAVIDWDTVMPGSVLSDYGDMVRTFVPDRYEDAPAEGLHLRTDVLQALEMGFLETADAMLTPAEREHLRLGAAWIIGEQALRFLTDFLAGDMYYKATYPEHNLVRARNQLTLLALL